MTIAGLWRDKFFKKRVNGKNKLYQGKYEQKERLAYQLHTFNHLWLDMAKRIPAYRDLLRTKQVPERFSSWKELVETIPPMTKQAIQKNVKDFQDPLKKHNYFRITGGTTAQPVQIPAWRSENEFTSIDIWIARSWYGIHPGDKLFLLWGHSHLLGSGWKGRLNAKIRCTKDRLLGYCRYSAYNLDNKNLRQAAHEMILFKPAYIIGYSVALDSFVKANSDLSESFKKLNVKAVIGAAEAFPRENSVADIEDFFGCKIGMEYGSVETNLIGHTHPAGGYRIFFDTYFIEAIDTAPGGGKTLRITSLYPRCVPLVRYEIGDAVELFEDDDPLGLWRFKKVIGRCNLFVTLKDGTRIHSEAFTHCVRDNENILRYQAVQSNGKICLNLVLKEKSVHNIPVYEKLLRERLEKIHPQLRSASIAWVDELRHTVAGKTPMVIKE